ncbi:MAG TPA: serine/threonine-protein kinase, partial [Ktedonobacteraceae bacterium]|nr:serine/threonine-protein kinase [Ktedonobacteraceae bacterium]
MNRALYCDICGAANRTQAAYCSSCGQPLFDPMGDLANNRLALTGNLQPGFLLRQRYRIIDYVGKGGFGAVYKTEDLELGNRIIAIKEMSQFGLRPEEVSKAIEIFKGEAVLLATLMHPNLPRIYEQFGENNRWYLVMDFINGTTLEKYILSKNNRIVPVAEVIDIAIQLCSVLSYLHTREPSVIFRDLKPANIMRTPEGHIYLIDFGIARHFKPGQLKDTASIGSIGYAAPEQFGHMQTSPRTDLFSLGVILHQMLTGNDPVRFAPQSVPLPKSKHPAIQHLGHLINRMLQVDSNRRPSNAAAVKSELQQILLQLSQDNNRLFPDNFTRIEKAETFQMPVRPKSQSPRPTPPFPQQLPPALPGSIPQIMIKPPDTPQPDNIPQPPERKATLVTIYRGHGGLVEALAWSPNGQRIASGSWDNTILIWDNLLGNTILTFKAHHIVFSLDWSPEDNTLVSGGYDGTVQIWNTSPNHKLFSSRRQSVYRGHQGAVYAVACSPAGGVIASAGLDKTVQIWSPTQLSKILSYHEHKGAIFALAWSPDGKKIASGGEDHTVHVWNANSGQGLLNFQKHTSAIKTLAWSPDARYIASGSPDKSIHVWESKTGNIIASYRRHTDEVTSLAWSPDGKMIVT